MLFLCLFVLQGAVGQKHSFIATAAIPQKSGQSTGWNVGPMLTATLTPPLLICVGPVLVTLSIFFVWECLSAPGEIVSEVDLDIGGLDPETHGIEPDQEAAARTHETPTSSVSLDAIRAFRLKKTAGRKSRHTAPRDTAKPGSVFNATANGSI